MTNGIPKAGEARRGTIRPLIESDPKATAKTPETATKDSLTKSEHQNSRSPSHEQSVREGLAPKNEHSRPTERSKVLSFDDLPVEVIQNILRFADEIRENLPPLSYVDARMLQIAQDTPELMQNHLKLEQMLSNKRGDDYLAAIRQNLSTARACKASLRLPNDLTLEHLNELAALLRGSSQRPTLVVDDEPAQLYRQLGRKNGARFIIRLPSPQRIEITDKTRRAIRTSMEQLHYYTGSILSRYRF